MSATCDLCGEQIEHAEAVVDHFRVMHPDVYEPPARWPDGGLVVEDHTIEPGDFT